MHPEDALRSLGLELPATTTPLGRYVPAMRSGSLLFVAGHLPMVDGVPQFVGKVGREWTVEQGYEASRLTALAMMATIKASVGDLAKVSRVVKLLGMVNCTEEFTQTPQVINGASELFLAVWGEAGAHARSAVGLQQLPGGMAVEIEGIFEIGD